MNQTSSPGAIKAVEGKDGWLFLANDTNASDLQLTGKKLYVPGVLDAWRAELEFRIERLAELCPNPYVFMVSPNKESVHPEYLPANLVPAPQRPIHAFLDAVGDLLPIFYPVAELRAWSQLLDVFPKVDTHWTDFGGLCVARALAARLPAVSVPSLVDCEVKIEERTGDLGAKLVPLRTALWTSAAVRKPTSRVIFDNGLSNNGRLIIFEKPGPTKTRGVVFGDSFFYALLPFLREGVDRLVFVHAYSLDLEILAHERPDFVISETVERFMIEPPTPARSFSSSRHIRLKMEALSIDAQEALDRACSSLAASPADEIYARLHRHAAD